MLKEGCYYKLVLYEMDWAMHPEICKELLSQFGGGCRKLVLVNVSPRSYSQKNEYVFKPKSGLATFFTTDWIGIDNLYEMHPKEILEGILND